ncbi:hypothetical protein AB0B25_15555 [Nocardia sp. NPDC049190]|uniref:hypothetical protein n=1 Tax=Nocardia sp. NPDC049190 TaxID=3155650 RepID=UPI0033DC59FD
MESPTDFTLIRRAAAGLAFIPLTAAALLTAPPATADPTAWPSLGDLTSGSAMGEATVTTNADSVGPELALGPPRPTTPPATGSFARRSDSTGGTESIGGPLALDPTVAAADATPTGSSDALGLDSGSVATACTGSAVAGSALITLGSATASWWPRAALGSAAVGSAAAGSGLLTCLLLLPGAPIPDPYLPLHLGPPLPGSPAPPPTPPSPAPAPPALPPIAPRTPAVTTGSLAYQRPSVLPLEDHAAWNVLQLITVMVVAVLTAATRGRIAHARNRS